MMYRKMFLAGATALSVSLAQAAVDYPATEVQAIGADAGVSISGTELDVEATVLGYLTPAFVDIADLAFILDGSLDYSLGPLQYFDGTFDIGGGLITGTFDDLLVFGGSITGLLEVSSGSTATPSPLLNGLNGQLEGNYSGSAFAAKIGTVVPVPAAAWLFGSALIGLGSLRRHK